MSKVHPDLKEYATSILERIETGDPRDHQIKKFLDSKRQAITTKLLKLGAAEMFADAVLFDGKAILFTGPDDIGERETVYQRFEQQFERRANVLARGFCPVNLSPGIEKNPITCDIGSFTSNMTKEEFLNVFAERGFIRRDEDEYDIEYVFHVRGTNQKKHLLKDGDIAEAVHEMMMLDPIPSERMVREVTKYFSRVQCYEVLTANPHSHKEKFDELAWDIKDIVE